MCAREAGHVAAEQVEVIARRLEAVQLRGRIGRAKPESGHADVGARIENDGCRRERVMEQVRSLVQDFADDINVPAPKSDRDDFGAESKSSGEPRSTPAPGDQR